MIHRAYHGLDRIEINVAFHAYQPRHLPLALEEPSGTQELLASFAGPLKKPTTHLAKRHVFRVCEDKLS